MPVVASATASRHSFERHRRYLPVIDPPSSTPLPSQCTLPDVSDLSFSYKAQVSAIVRQFADPSVAASSRRYWDKTPGGGGQTAGGVVVSTCDAFQVRAVSCAAGRALSDRIGRGPSVRL